MCYLVNNRTASARGLSCGDLRWRSVPRGFQTFIPMLKKQKNWMHIACSETPNDCDTLLIRRLIGGGGGKIPVAGSESHVTES